MVKKSIASIAVIVAVALPLACKSIEPTVAQSGQVTGVAFPQATGTALGGREWTIPDDMAGEPTLLLVGYLQNAQFDIDRWLVGLFQIETPVTVYEIPTIRGMVPSLFAGYIDDGMRSGIPEEDWGAVITVYGDAENITGVLGTENPRNAQVVLLDGDGVIRWFHNRGFSASVLMEMDEVARGLE